MGVLLFTVLVGGGLLYSADQRTQESLASVQQQVLANNRKFCAVAGTIATSPAQTDGGRELRHRAAAPSDDLGCGQLPAP